jgi:uncharacterized protein (DUF2062 family)
MISFRQNGTGMRVDFRNPWTALWGSSVGEFPLHSHPVKYISPIKVVVDYHHVFGLYLMDIVESIKTGAVRHAKKIGDLIVRELRANTSPGKASLSLGLGVLVGFSPLYGLQTVLLLLLAVVLRLNRPLALLGGSATPLPLVPFWIAAGIFTGKLVIPLSTVNQLLLADKAAIPLQVLVHGGRRVFAPFKHLLPAEIINKIDLQSGNQLAAGIIQWAIGSCVFAGVCAITTVIVTYPLFKRISASRMESQARREGK